jgi:Glycine rich protein/Bacterial Ig domain
MHRARRFLAIPLAAAVWSTPAVAQATVFFYTGGEQGYLVPAGVSSLSITAIGAPGGGPLSGGLAAGRGAVVAGVVTVSPGQVVYVEVGGSGGSPVGGFNGGGDSGTASGISVYGGGGASDVRTLSMSAGVISLNSRLIVAAGGGGSGAPAAAGGDAGAAGGSAPNTPVGGGAGTQTAGGAGGCEASLVGCGTNGSLGVGGTGGSSGAGAGAREGAGGGGGLYGGGGGGGVSSDGVVGGGGGGSSLVPADLGTLRLASLTTAPIVEIAPVPPPACQDLTTSTPFGRAVSVQLGCTEFASRPLTYAIVGTPAHGTLSAVTATGQVTYTPVASFRGNDSFTYEASSTNGTSNVASVSIAVSPPSVATAGHARASRIGAKIPVTCNHSGVGVGSSCDVTVTMSVTEILRAHKHVAMTSAKSTRPKATRKVVTVGRVSVVIGAGKTQVIDIRLNGKGKRLLAARGKLSVSIVVTQTLSAATEVVAHQRLSLESASAKHKKTR